MLMLLTGMLPRRHPGAGRGQGEIPRRRHGRRAADRDRADAAGVHPRGRWPRLRCEAHAAKDKLTDSLPLNRIEDCAERDASRSTAAPCAAGTERRKTLPRTQAHRRRVPAVQAPAHLPSRHFQALANSAPADLTFKYVLVKKPTDDFVRPWEEKRLDLAVENVAWDNSATFPTSVGAAANKRPAEIGSDVGIRKYR